MHFLQGSLALDSRFTVSCASVITPKDMGTIDHWETIAINTSNQETYAYFLQLTSNTESHDDVIKWIFSALLALCAGNSPVPGEFPAQRPVTRSFDVFFDLRLNKRLSKQSRGWCLRRHRVHYDVIVMLQVDCDYQSPELEIETRNQYLWIVQNYVRSYMCMSVCVCACVKY